MTSNGADLLGDNSESKEPLITAAAVPELANTAASENGREGS